MLFKSTPTSKRIKLTVFNTNTQKEICLDEDVEFTIKLMNVHERNEMNDLLHGSDDTPFEKLGNEERHKIFSGIIKLGLLGVKGIFLTKEDEVSIEKHGMEAVIETFGEIRIPGSDNLVKWLGLKIWSENNPTLLAIKN